MRKLHDHLQSAVGVAPLLCCFSHLRWNFVYQRPQHLMSRAARSHDVVFVEEPLFEACDHAHLRWTTEPEGVRVAVPILKPGTSGPQATRAQRHLVDQFLRSCAGQLLILWYYTPMALPFSRHLAADLRVYDNMDELSAFRDAPPRLAALEREMFRRADVVFTGGNSLYEVKRSRHGNIHSIPSSVDTAHFARARRVGRVDPGDQLGIARPRMGFFGVIDERLDVGLVGALADLRPDWQIVMIGPVVKIGQDLLPRRPNLHWLGGKQYADLPAYLGGWDVGIMPFALNESTRFISPTKTPEFLAAGLPVVSTPITDVVHPYGRAHLVEIADGPEDFAQKVSLLLERPREAWRKRVDQHLASMSWDATWAAMDRLGQEAIERSHALARQETNLRAAHV